MNRVIKFRCWNPTGQCMHFWPELVEKNKIHLLAQNSASYPIMQFTGLCDVNGVEVYEDDIVYVAGLGNAIVRTSCHCGVFYETADDYQTYSDCAAEGDYPTVIGNVHQHPELLK